MLSFIAGRQCNLVTPGLRPGDSFAALGAIRRPGVRQQPPGRGPDIALQSSSEPADERPLRQIEGRDGAAVFGTGDVVSFPFCTCRQG